MDSLSYVEHWEDWRLYFEEKMKNAIESRNKNIYKAFKAGYRQKDIANISGLSESRIKKIIGEMKNAKQEK